MQLRQPKNVVKVTQVLSMISHMFDSREVLYSSSSRSYKQNSSVSLWGRLR